MADEVKQEEVKEKTPREEIYNQYQEQLPGIQPDAEETPETTETPEEVKPPEEKAEVKEEKKEEKREKLVPYDALHEERMKRKAEAEARKKAEERIKEYEAELLRMKSPEEEAGVITDYDKELLEMKRKVAAWESIETKRQEREQEEARQRARGQFETAMKQIDTELEAEGYPGFRFAQGAVHQEIYKMIAEDESNAIFDNITGWKKVYRDKFYPDMAKQFSEALKKSEIKAKEDLKSKANLSSVPGKAPAKPKDNEPVSQEEAYAAYMKQRRGI